MKARENQCKEIFKQNRYKKGEKQMKRMRKKRMGKGLAKNVANERIKGREGRVTETIRRTRERGNKRVDK